MGLKTYLSLNNTYQFKTNLKTRILGTLYTCLMSWGSRMIKNFHGSMHVLVFFLYHSWLPLKIINIGLCILLISRVMFSKTKLWSYLQGKWKGLCLYNIMTAVIARVVSYNWVCLVFCRRFFNGFSCILKFILFFFVKPRR